MVPGGPAVPAVSRQRWADLAQGWFQGLEAPPSIRRWHLLTRPTPWKYCRIDPGTD